MPGVPFRYARKSSGLVRQLRWWDVLFITISAPTGSGILYYAVRTSGQPGGNIAIAFAIGALLFLPMVLSSLVLVAAMPRSGGPYVGVSRLLHPSLGYLAAMVSFRQACKERFFCAARPGFRLPDAEVPVQGGAVDAELIGDLPG